LPSLVVRLVITIDTNDVVAQIPYSGNEHLVALCVDSRPYVLDRNKTPEFVGLSRGGYGNPFDIRTDSGEPLSDDIAHALVEQLNSKGFDAIALQTHVGDQVQNAVDAITASGRPLGVVFVLREWKSDMYVRTALIYDVTLSVFDSRGKLLASSTIQGKDNLGSAFWALNPGAESRQFVHTAFESKLEVLLSDPEIKNALGAKPIPSPQAAALQ
jgi:hypothetical protein